MDNSIYVTLSRQKAVFREMTMTANNLANTNTPGYQTEHMMFTDYLVKEGDRTAHSAEKLAFTQDISSWRDTAEGPFKQTGNPLDVAITGPGFFIVETGGGQRYTRSGTFTMGNDGTLMTASGLPVLGNDGQRIEFDITDKLIQIGSNGVVTTTNQEGLIEERGAIGLVEFADTQDMTRLDGQLYETAQQPVPAEMSTVTQGAIEMSNVSAVSELVKVTELSRSTSSTAKFIEVMYDLTRKTSNAYARASNS